MLYWIQPFALCVCTGSKCVFPNASMNQGNKQITVKTYEESEMRTRQKQGSVTPRVSNDTELPEQTKTTSCTPNDND